MIATYIDYYFGGKFVDQSAEVIAKCIANSCRKPSTEEADVTALKVALIWAGAAILIAVACCVNPVIGLTIGLSLGIPFVKPIYKSLRNQILGCCCEILSAPKNKMTPVAKQALEDCEAAEIQLKELQDFEKKMLAFFDAHPDFATEFNKEWQADENVIKFEPIQKDKMTSDNPFERLSVINQQIILLNAKKREFIAFLERKPAWAKLIEREYQNFDRVKSKETVVEEL